MNLNFSFTIFFEYDPHPPAAIRGIGVVPFLPRPVALVDAVTAWPAQQPALPVFLELRRFGDGLLSIGEVLRDAVVVALLVTESLVAARIVHRILRRAIVVLRQAALVARDQPRVQRRDHFPVRLSVLVSPRVGQVRRQDLVAREGVLHGGERLVVVAAPSAAVVGRAVLATTRDPRRRH